jgi:cobalt-zinc-cadmium efflux system protein
MHSHDPDYREHPHEHHVTSIKHISLAFIVGIILNMVFVLVEVFAGFFTNSLGLLADAGHNFMDVISLVLAMLAFKLSKIKPTEKYTYGYQKTTIIVALINALLLLVAIGSIATEATKRLFVPVQTDGTTVSIVAGIGILINGITAFFFYRSKEKDLNIKGAYLHLLADALVSIGVVIAGVVIYFTHFYWMDILISYIIIIVIFISTWKLLRNTLRLSLDGVPSNVDVEKIKQEVNSTKGVINIHHIHIWAMSTTQNALTAHIAVQSNLSFDEVENIKHEIKHTLEHLNIHHATLETEIGDCENKECDHNH